MSSQLEEVIVDTDFLKTEEFYPNLSQLCLYWSARCYVDSFEFRTGLLWCWQGAAVNFSVGRQG
jgi:hypothetical protein